MSEEYGLTECAIKCRRTQKPCSEKSCRKWIDYEDEMNCCLISINEKKGCLTLMETGERLGLSFVRIRQIEKMAIEKLSKRI